VSSLKPAEVTTVSPTSIKPVVAELPPISFNRPLGSTLRVKLDGLVVRAAPSIHSDALLQLGLGSVVTLGAQNTVTSNSFQWLPISIGQLTGWVAKQWVEPTKLEPIVKAYTNPAQTEVAQLPQTLRGNVRSTALASASQTLSLGSARTAQTYAVSLRHLPVRLTADVNAPIVSVLSESQLIKALDIPQYGAWTAIEANGQRGWVNTQWLQPVATPNLESK
jgi:pilus assembly protein CpaC